MENALRQDPIGDSRTDPRQRQDLVTRGAVQVDDTGWLTTDDRPFGHGIPSTTRASRPGRLRALAPGGSVAPTGVLGRRPRSAPATARLAGERLAARAVHGRQLLLQP